MKIRKILAPVDFSDVSEHALSYATGLAADLGAKMLVIYVVEPIVFAGSPIAPEMSVPHLIEDQRRAAAESVDKLVARLAKRKIEVEGMVRTGTAYHVIVDSAAAESCDLIIMGTHGRGGLGHFLLGSVAEKVVRLSPCPVLTVRGGDQPAKQKTKGAKARKKSAEKG